MENVPLYLSVTFLLTTGLTLWFLYQATNRTRLVTIVVVLWLLGQSLLAVNQFYTVTDAVPPRFIFLIVPPLLLLVALFFTSPGRRYLDFFNPKILTLLHVVRIPVELVLFGLALRGVVPQLMTFEGRNFDILAGLSAPFVYYFGFVKNQMSKTLLLTWNFICLGLLLNIIVNAILSVPTPFQQFAFDQPNIALLYFPFVLLPCVVVPVVLLAHFVTIRHLFRWPGKATADQQSTRLPAKSVN